jgi:hypothetical protein
MTDLSVFSMAESELLVSLPYRVGVWVGHAEDEEGETDDVRESKALQSCIKQISALHDDVPFIKNLVAQTLRLRSEWPRWQAQSFNIIDDAAKAMNLLKSKATAAEAKAYRAMLMEIATAVAQAHGEFGQWGEADEGFFARVAGKLKSLSQDSDDHPMNVSAAEETAISELATVLKQYS